MNFAIRATIMLIFLITQGACTRESSFEEHIVKANQFVAESEYDAAVIELKNALQKDRQSGEARWLLGKVYLASGDELSAEKELQRSLDLGWPANDVVPALAESLLSQGKYAEVLELGTDELQPEAEARLLAKKALAAMAMGDHQEARKQVSMALDKYPQSTEALLVNARILATQGDLTGTEAALGAALELDPENASAWALQGDIRTEQQKLDEALEAYNRALGSQENNYGLLFKRSLLLIKLGNYEAAQADATALLRVAPQSAGANYIQGIIHFQAEQYKQAIPALLLAEPAYKEFPLVLFFLGVAQLEQGHLDQASIQAARFNKIAPESIPGRKLSATLRLRESQYEVVQDLLRPVLDSNPNDVDALNLMSNALLRGGKAEEAIPLLSRAAELQPGSAVAQIRLGTGLLLGGEPDVAVEHVGAALKLKPDFEQADILLVINHVQAQDYEAAIEAAEAYRQKNLTSTTPLNLMGKVYLAAGRQDKAKESFEKALTLDIGDPAANHSLAQMSIASQDLVLARHYYATILEHHADNLLALIQLALLDAKEQKDRSLVAHLERGIDRHPAALEPRQLLGWYYLNKGRPEKVAPLFSTLDELQKQSPQVLQLMALAQLAQKEPKQAQFTLKKLEASKANTAPFHHLMAMTAFRIGDSALGEKELNNALEIDQNYLPSRIALARLVMQKGEIDEFHQQLAILTSQAPRNPDVLLLRAVYASRRGDIDEAVTLSNQAYTLLPSATTLLALGLHTESTGNREKASSLYHTWIAANPEDIAVRMAAANNFQAAQRIDEAIFQYEKILQLDPDNVVALNNLAWHIREKNPVQALEYARHASRLAPHSADILDTLAVVLYFNKEYEEAQRTVKGALLRTGYNPTLRYHSAMISAAMGDSDSAIKLLEELRASGTEFPEVVQANELLVALKK